MVPAAVEAMPVFLRRTSPRLAALWCRECEYPPTGSPTGRDKLALAPDSQSEVLSKAFSARAPHPTQLCLFGLDRVTHTRLNFAFSVWISDSTGHSHCPVVSQQIAIERI